MAQLRKMMLEELQRVTSPSETVRGYIGVVEGFARHFGKRPTNSVQTTYGSGKRTCYINES